MSWVGRYGYDSDMSSEDLMKSLAMRINEDGYVIVAAPQKVELGHVLKGVSNISGDDKLEHPFVMVREASYEEWVAQNKKFGSADPYAKPIGWDFFYEVRTD